MAAQFLDAVKQGDRATVDRLLDADPSLAAAKDERGGDPNAKSREGGTPLHSAAYTGDLEIAELLLAYGSDPGATDVKGSTPLDIARDRGNVEVAALLHHAVTNRKRV